MTLYKRIKSRLSQYTNQVTVDVIVTSIIPVALTVLWLKNLIGVVIFSLGLFVSFGIFILFPIIFKYSYSIQRALLFLTFISYPADLDLSHPGRSGLYATRNFYITYRDPKRDLDVRLGVWHVLPNHVVKRFARQLNLSDAEVAKIHVSERAEQIAKLNEKYYVALENKYGSDFMVKDDETAQQFYEDVLHKTKSPVVFYCHGNTASRGTAHRVEMYQLMRQLGFHVVAFDYRGYGDSSKLGPSARSVVLDAHNVYQYIVNLTDEPVLLWGHSLGTGIGTHLMAEIQDHTLRLPVGVVLESPFNNIKDEISEHPFARIFRNLPWFEFTIVNPMYENQLKFESDRWISKVSQPVMILHAEDDRVVPFHLGYKLYRTALDTRPKSFGPIEFHRFERARKLGHKFICRAEELPSLVETFFENYKGASYKE